MLKQKMINHEAPAYDVMVREECLKIVMFKLKPEG